jgi:eukaryotic-like serine/threonine-protein kinase
MGQIYEALQSDLGRRVAVKVLAPHLAYDAEAIARFEREARSAAALGQGNIAQVTDFQNAPGQMPFLVMEYLEGQSMGSALRREGRIPEARVVFIMSQVLLALSAAHAAGIVHRDIKPDNIFLVSMSGMSDIVKLLDFGIAKLTKSDAPSDLTALGGTLGSPYFLSPEQARGASADHRADLHAVGATMFRAITGHYPFDGANLPALLHAIGSQVPPPLSSVSPVSPQLSAIVARALAKDPALRFQSADEMRAALAQLGSPSARPAPIPMAAPVFGPPSALGPPAGSRPPGATGQAPPQPYATANTSAGTGHPIATQASARPAPSGGNGALVFAIVALLGVALLLVLGVAGYAFYRVQGQAVAPSASVPLASASAATPIPVANTSAVVTTNTTTPSSTGTVISAGTAQSPSSPSLPSGPGASPRASSVVPALSAAAVGDAGAAPVPSSAPAASYKPGYKPIPCGTRAERSGSQGLTAADSELFASRIPQVGSCFAGKFSTDESDPGRCICELTYKVNTDGSVAASGFVPTSASAYSPYVTEGSACECARRALANVRFEPRTGGFIAGKDSVRVGIRTRR